MEDKEPLLPEGWQKCYSKSHNAYYYFNAKNGKTSWTFPANELNRDLPNRDALPTQDSKRRRLDEHKVAIIVPFRDLHAEQNRQKHLKKFAPNIVKFLQQSMVPFHIFIIEQSDDGRKFNRGKLLNIGFKIAIERGYRTAVFHDVDLLPVSPLLLSAYTSPVAPNEPIHIAKLWKDRYSSNDNYFGGIVKFSEEQFNSINGFPNNFWGWGGEDDEMYKRVREVIVSFRQKLKR